MTACNVTFPNAKPVLSLGKFGKATNKLINLTLRVDFNHCSFAYSPIETGAVIGPWRSPC